VFEVVHLGPHVTNVMLGTTMITSDRLLLQDRIQSVKSIDFTTPESSRLEGLVN